MNSSHTKRKLTKGLNMREEIEFHRHSIIYNDDYIEVTNSYESNNSSTLLYRNDWEEWLRLLNDEIEETRAIQNRLTYIIAKKDAIKILQERKRVSFFGARTQWKYTKMSKEAFNTLKELLNELMKK